MNTHKQLFQAVLAVFAMALFSSTASAVPITGELDIAGGVIIWGGTNPAMIDWTMPVDAGIGTAFAQDTSTGTFQPFGAAHAAVIEKDLLQSLYPTSGFAPLDAFETLGTIDFTLLDLLSCAELGPNVTCSAGPTSPFGFAQNSLGTTVTMGMTGTVFDTTSRTLVSNWSGLWTAQFPGRTIASLLDQLNTTGQIETSYSASKITANAVPEPASLFLLGTGLFSAAVRARRKKARG